MPKKTETIAVDNRGQISVRLGGADYVLRPSYEAIEASEEETGLSLFDLATLASNCRMKVKDMGVVVAAMMRAHGKENPDDPMKTQYLGAKADKISRLIHEAGPAKIMGRLSILLSGALLGGYTASGEAIAATEK